MNEKQLQSKIVIEFSQRFPEQRGQFFHVSNERNHQLQAFQANSLGIVKGVSDMFYIMSNDGKIVLRLLEIKVHGSSHKKDHLISQLEWAKQMESHGAQWSVITSVESAMEFITNGTKEFDCSDIQNMINCTGNKTVKIQRVF